MAKALVDNFTKEELEKIVQDSHSYKDVLRGLGYGSCNGNSYKTVKTRIVNYGIDTSHFQEAVCTKRSEENIFIEHSTATQSVLRRWYKKGEYTPYKCAICGQEPFWQGKELTLTLDHINGINGDDRLENLRWVCPNCDRQLDTFARKKDRAKKEDKTITNYCVKCGKPITKKATRCDKCAREASRVVDRPSREELKQLIRTTPFVQIASKFNVTDNAIRKWCDGYSLPRKVTDIKHYSDKEWEQL